MNNKVYIGNLPWSTGTDDLASALRELGYTFRSVKVISDRETGKSRGFAFVEFETPAAAAEAIKNLDNYILDGRPLQASEARERPERSGGGGGGDGRNGGGGGGGGGRSHGDGFRDGVDRGDGGRDRRGHRDRREPRGGNEW